MKEQREIENQEEFERSLKDRIYLGALILFGFISGICTVGVIMSVVIKVSTGNWPNWL